MMAKAEMKPHRIAEVLEDSWCLLTAYKEEWSFENKALNQCAVTALVVQDFFGGEILKGRVTGTDSSHYWNRIGGVEMDFTITQYPPGTTIDPEWPIDRVTLLKHPDTFRRYLILRERVADHLDFLYPVL